MSRVKTKHLLTYQVQDVVLKDRAYSTVVVHRIRIAEMRVRFSLSPQIATLQVFGCEFLPRPSPRSGLGKTF